MKALANTLCAVCLASICSPSFAQFRYRVIDLGEVPGDDGTFVYQANHIDNNGRVVGTYYSNIFFNAGGVFVWSPSSGMTALPLPAGAIQSVGSSMNSSGSVAGSSLFGVPFEAIAQATVWDRSGTPRLLGPAPQFTGSSANDIAADGAAFGSIDFVPTVWSPSGVARSLPAPEGFVGGYLTSHNDRGDIVGATENLANGQQPAVIWLKGTTPTLMGLLTPSVFSEPLFTVPLAVNDQQTVVGYGQSIVFSFSGGGTEQDGFEWSPASGFSLLPSLGTRPDETQALSINNEGQIVGFSQAPQFGPTDLAVIWENGQVTNLNDVSDLSAGWFLSVAAGINDKGEIVGSGFLSPPPFTQFFLHAFLLEPIRGQ